MENNPTSSEGDSTAPFLLSHEESWEEEDADENAEDDDGQPFDHELEAPATEIQDAGDDVYDMFDADQIQRLEDASTLLAKSPN